MRRIATLLLAGALCACATAPADRDAAARTSHRAQRPVIIVSVDGLRPDAIVRFGAGTLQALAAAGATTYEARTVEPSNTLPSHASMLTGVPPSVHGITWNSDRTGEFGRVGVPTVFDIAEASGLHSAAFAGKAKLRHLFGVDAPRTASAPHGTAVWLAPRVVEDAERYLRFARPDLLFVHISDPDLAGHALGWLGLVYGRAVLRADNAVARVIAAADRAYGRCGYTMIVTADHGGSGRSHSALDDDNELIPWIAWGAGVRQGMLRQAVRTEDTAATVLTLLGLDVPADWAGRPVTEALQTSRRGVREAAVRAPAAAGISACAPL